MKKEDWVAMLVAVIFLLVSVWAYTNYLYLDERWVGAIGSILGGIIGGVITLTVMFKTNKVARDNNDATLEEMRIQRKVSIEPFLRIKNNTTRIVFEINKNEIENVDRTLEKYEDFCNRNLFDLAIENIGYGFAKNIIITLCPNNECFYSEESRFHDSLKYKYLNILLFAEGRIKTGDVLNAGALKQNELKNINFWEFEKKLQLAIFENAVALLENYNREGNNLFINITKSKIHVRYKNALGDELSRVFILQIIPSATVYSEDSVKIDFNIELEEAP